MRERQSKKFEREKGVKIKEHPVLTWNPYLSSINPPL